MNLSELISFLTRIGRRPNKGLSQCFLIDENVVQKIIEIADIGTSAVLEIGPGPGALTQKLIQKEVPVFAVEKDAVLASELERFDAPNLRAYSLDFLKFPLESLKKFAPLKVVANLPYHITTPILEKLIESRELFSTFTIMIQDEVADRMFAPSKSKEYGSLSIFSQFYLELITSFKVAPNCFYPSPKVSSRVIHLRLKEKPIEDDILFFKLVRTAFQQRRKMIKSTLSALYAQETVASALTLANLKATARPEELSLDEWLFFYSKLIK